MFNGLGTLVGARRWRLSRWQGVVRQILNGVDAAQKLSDAQFRNRARELRWEAKGGASLVSLLPEVYALAIEAIDRELGLRLFPIQVLGSVALFHNHIAEMQTGEGKTVTGLLPAVLRAMMGRGVHVITANEYLAGRDAALLGPVFERLGLRVKLEESTGTKKFVWDDQNYLGETDAANDTQVVYTNEPQRYGNLVSQRRGSTSHWYQFDALGSTRELTDSSAIVSDTRLYDAWGNAIATTGSTVSPLRWLGGVGYYSDQNNGLYYVRARVYRPQTIRWLSKDPIWNSLFNYYTYGNNSPLMYADPTGYLTVCALVRAAAAAMPMLDDIIKCHCSMAEALDLLPLEEIAGGVGLVAGGPDPSDVVILPLVSGLESLVGFADCACNLYDTCFCPKGLPAASHFLLASFECFKEYIWVGRPENPGNELVEEFTLTIMQ